MPIAKITPLGESGLYHIHVLDAVDPGFGHGPGAGTDPGFGRPIFGHPGNRPPGSGVFPDNTLPETPPPVLLPGYTLVMVRDAMGKWEYAAIMPGSPPPRPLPPGSIEHPGNRPPGSGLPPHVGGGPLPGQPGHPGNLPPGTEHPGGGPAPVPPDYVTGQPVPPMPSPTRR